MNNLNFQIYQSIFKKYDLMNLWRLIAGGKHMNKYAKFITCCFVAGLSVLSVVVTSCATSPQSTSVSANTLASVPSSANSVINMPSFADLIDAARPCVVEIDVSSSARVGRRTVQQQGAGSGWILDSNGTIVTNEHVIEGATTIIVTTSDGKTFPATVINSDPTTDLALVKINATQLKSMKIGDASKLRSGDWVLAVGNPLGEGIITTQGIVSRLGVSVPLNSTQTYNDLIETTAAINPGNSGGPLINMAGEVIGITTLGATGVQGMGYAISMVDAFPVIQKLSK
jgi:serine protease Do